MTTLSWGAASDTGRTRTVNQDTYLADDSRHLYLVADGMGGPRGGEVAAHLAVDTVHERFDDSSVEALLVAIDHANAAIYEQGSNEPGLRGMGTTLVAVALVDTELGEVLAVANIGDSRVYRLTNGELEQLTDDHSLVADLVRAGRLSPEEAEVHPQRNIVTRALGVYERIEVDTVQVDPNAGDRYLLCSDGLFNEVPLDQMAAVLRRLDDPGDAARELVRLANEGGGRDNITALVVDVVDDGGRAEQASAAVAKGASTGRREPDVAGFGTALDDDALEAAFGTAEEEGSRRSRRRAARAERKAAVEPKPRRLTWRVVAFLVVLVLLLGAAGGSIWWYGRNTYFVGFAGDSVAIYQGRPGGLLWLDPTLVEHTDIDRDDVPPDQLATIVSGHDASSLERARTFVENLEDRIEKIDQSTTTTTRPRSTSTTRARSTTTAP